MDKKNIMFLGTASSVGKSTIAAAICRYLKNQGFSVAPFKALNISLNSYVTKNGLEMGRAQVVQAEACKIEPDALMNPVLLKPSGNCTQVILNGKVFRNIEPYKYKELNKNLKKKVKEAYEKLKEDYDIIVLEGSGSCAEINLKDSDIANMAMAEVANAPVILVSDIDRGGVFASIVGTIQLLSEAERSRIKGVIINKFRGNVELFKPAIKQLEEIIKIPVLGVMPYEKFDIEDEDSVTERIKNSEEEGTLDIAIIRLSHMSNFTDFNILERMPGVTVRYVTKPSELKNPNLIIIPGTKSTIEDLQNIKENKLFNKIKELKANGTPIFGICGGYQMLGTCILDKLGVEGEISQEDGFGFLDIKTRFNETKITKQTKGEILCDLKLIRNIEASTISGYEIHNGISKIGKKAIPFIKDLEGNVVGVCDEEKMVAGTYLHGLFDSEEFMSLFVKSLKKYNNIITSEEMVIEKINEYKDNQYDKLAKLLEENINLEKLKEIIEI
ncbi:adenosylcobyric acid synthase [Clostridium saccharoperbutylacetonicum]|uniref:Cobyric acid synthase n=1 Tax=Clostridium saccharoperbutylacetonicum N1-4(HMT) TaxID=931276 RepID=M1MKC4_9CLOT|nr:cobyric acid synthase [Clostridium saccharoperbutylacetonicum]AGF55241.1 cobyric acid synthase CobQ [Clostridium saccharoperbutylacetonicum N1-4(HMT)]NRT64048.1 adenosylcobyric acid synthase [Clostridium saccharoperbutylacetonicum]NSB27415.1 adenosylcobyric acid synthase [Clostridium saccharoperbutylacetonicum]NSB40904.1 adenosylcobyric acid synthase [Clostridium saccharoperbutylacetonicum]